MRDQLSANVATRFVEITSTPRWYADLPELWQYRDLIWLLAWRNIKVRYKQTILGLVWAVLAPVSYTLIFLFLFRLVAVKAVGDLPYVPATFAAMIFWQFFSRGIGDAGTSLTANANLITKVYFPRLTLPLAAVLSGVIDLIPALILLGLVMIGYGVQPSAKLFAAPAFLALLVLVTLSCGLWISAIDALFRDLRHALPLLLQLGMFVSPVAYATYAMVPERWIGLYEWNPMVICLEGLRWSVFPGAAMPSTSMMAKGIATAAALLVTGAVFFSRIERTIVDKV